MSDAKVELGRYLFYDVRLSYNQTQSCASCHQQSLAFTDGRSNAVGSTGAINRRSAMSLANVAYNSAQTWANPILRSLEMQAAVPLFGTNPIELGMSGHEQDLVQRLRDEPRYGPMFMTAFPTDSDPYTVANVLRAIAAFERTIISGRSPYDRWVDGDASAISASAQRGASLFFGERFECHHCHGGFALTNSVTWEGKDLDELSYQNDALYNVDGAGAYPLRDRGLLEITQNAPDMGKFRPPTLRNVGITAPYMHDGTIATLRDVIVNHYARGGRLIPSGPDAGDGALSPLKAPFVSGFVIADDEVADLIAFLESTTDDDLIQNPALANPW
jgi:cytochrome c peroxidase